MTHASSSLFFFVLLQSSFFFFSSITHQTMSVPSVKFYNGNEIPIFGLGYVHSFLFQSSPISLSYIRIYLISLFVVPGRASLRRSAPPSSKLSSLDTDYSIVPLLTATKMWLALPSRKPSRWVLSSVRTCSSLPNYGIGVCFLLNHCFSIGAQISSLRMSVRPSTRVARTWESTISIYIWYISIDYKLWLFSGPLAFWIQDSSWGRGEERPQQLVLRPFLQQEMCRVQIGVCFSFSFHSIVGTLREWRRPGLRWRSCIRKYLWWSLLSFVGKSQEYWCFQFHCQEIEGISSYLWNQACEQPGIWILVIKGQSRSSCILLCNNGICMITVKNNRSCWLLMLLLFVLIPTTTSMAPSLVHQHSSPHKIAPVENPVIVNLAKKYNKTPAEICIRWAVQRGTICIPKTTTVSRLAENINVFDFELTEEEMASIRSIDEGRRCVNGESCLPPDMKWQDAWDGESINE